MLVCYVEKETSMIQLNSEQWEMFWEVMKQFKCMGGFDQQKAQEYRDSLVEGELEKDYAFYCGGNNE